MCVCVCVCVGATKDGPMACLRIKRRRSGRVKGSTRLKKKRERGSRWVLGNRPGKDPNENNRRSSFFSKPKKSETDIFSLPSKQLLPTFFCKVTHMIRDGGGRIKRRAALPCALRKESRGRICGSERFRHETESVGLDRERLGCCSIWGFSRRLVRCCWSIDRSPGAVVGNAAKRTSTNRNKNIQRKHPNQPHGNKKGKL